MNPAPATNERPQLETPVFTPSRPPSPPLTSSLPPTEVSALQAGASNSALAAAMMRGTLGAASELMPFQGDYGNAAVVGQQTRTQQGLGPQSGGGDTYINAVGTSTERLAHMGAPEEISAQAAVRNADRGSVVQIKDKLQPGLQAITARAVPASGSQVDLPNSVTPASSKGVRDKTTRNPSQTDTAGESVKPGAEQPAVTRTKQGADRIAPADQEKAVPSQKAKPGRAASPGEEQSVGIGDISGESGGEMLTAPPAVRMPEPVAPVDAGGQPLPPDPSSDDMVAQLAAQVQTLRTQAFALRQQAAEMRSNAQLLRSNVNLVRRHVGDSNNGLAQAQEQNMFRRSVVEQGPAALQASGATAENVASRAPEGEARAQQERARSQPMTGEARDLVGQSESNVPRDDPDAAAKAREQSGKLSRVGDDIAQVDDAVAQAGRAAGQLGQDAEHAKQQNSVAKGKIDATRLSVDQNDSRISDLQGRNAAASAQLEGLASGPAQLLAGADALDAEAGTLMEHSQQLEAQLHDIQQSYTAYMRSVPAVQAPSDGADATPDEGMGQLPVSASATTAEIEEASAEGEEANEPEVGPAEVSALEVGNQAGEIREPSGPSQPSSEEETQHQEVTRSPAAATEGNVAAQPEPQPVNLGEGLGWLTGEEEPNAEDRRNAKAAADERHQQALQLAAGSVNEDFSRLSAGDKRMRALRIVGQNLFGGVGKITWAGVGRGAVNLAKGLLDPRSTLAGVISGLNMIFNGVAGFVREPSWGGLLKSAADIALGLTIILGSITALAGLIIAAMIALSVVTVGAAAPITGPVIAFCTTVMTTVGGWTLYVGLVAAGLQALVFLKDLYMAGTAQTANQLVNHADAMTQDASNAGNALLQAGMGKLAQVGGRQMQGAIARAGGGVGFSRQIGQRSLLGQAVRGSRLATRMTGGGRLARVAAGARIFGRGVARSAQGTLRGITGAGGRMVGRIGRGLRAARRLGLGRTARVLGQRGWRAIGRGGQYLLGAGRRLQQGVGEIFAGGIRSGMRRVGGRILTGTKAWFREGLEDIRTGFSREFLTGEGGPIRAPGTRMPPAAGELTGGATHGEPQAPKPAAAERIAPTTPEPAAPVEQAGTQMEAPAVTQEPAPKPVEVSPPQSAEGAHPRLAEAEMPPQLAEQTKVTEAEVLAAEQPRSLGFSESDRPRLERIRDELGRNGLDWSDIGLHSEDDLHRLVQSQGSSDSAIVELERRLNQAIDIRGVRAEFVEPPGLSRNEEMRGPGMRRDDPQWSESAARVEENRVFGGVNEQHGQQFLTNHFDNVESQVRIRPILDNGQPAPYYFIADNLGTSRAGGQIIAFDAKLTSGAPLTVNQQMGYPLLGRNGGIVESHGLGRYPYRTRLDPVQTYRLLPRVSPRTAGNIQPTRDFFRLQPIF